MPATTEAAATKQPTVSTSPHADRQTLDVLHPVVAAFLS